MHLFLHCTTACYSLCSLGSFMSQLPVALIFRGANGFTQHRMFCSASSCQNTFSWTERSAGSHGFLFSFCSLPGPDGSSWRRWTSGQSWTLCRCSLYGITMYTANVSLGFFFFSFTLPLDDSHSKPLDPVLE